MTIESRKDREARVTDLYNQGQGYQEIAKELRMSFRDISHIIKKARGEESSETNHDPKEQYSKIYQLFSEGKSPLQVAIALSLPADYALEQYQNFLKASRLYRLVQFYEQNGGDDGARIVLSIWDSMRQSGYSDLTITGSYVKSCQDVHEAGYDLESLRQEHRRVRGITDNERKEIGRLQQQKADEQKSLAEISKAVQAKKRELVTVTESAKRLLQTYPEVGIEQLVNTIVEVKVRSYWDMIDLALASVIHAFKTSPNSKFIAFPQMAPLEIFSIPDGQRKLQQTCIVELNNIAQDYYLRVLKNARESVRRQVL